MNFKSNTVWISDNLPVLRGINDACIDLIYLDPPFNSNKTYSAPVGSKAAGASFKDAWTLDDIDVHEHGELADRNPAAYAVIEAARATHGKSMMSYLIFMAVRLLEMHRVLKDTGSIYLHCDTTASHYLKLLMDAIFGKNNFRNEIVWCYKSGGAPKKGFAKKHDTLFFYTLGNDYCFNLQKEKSYNRRFKRYNFKGVEEFEDEMGWHTMVNMKDYWDIDMVGRTSKERTGYPTQKPLPLLERIINASSNKGDMILDPFCGCATSLVAAYRMERQWVGIDISPMAIKLVNDRIMHGDRSEWDKQGSLFEGAIKLTKPPDRTDLGKLPNYRTHAHKLYGEQEGVCIGCDLHFPFKNMEVDHITPKAKGGTDHIDNLQLLCNACNRSKGVKTMAEWRAG
ncbi:MAG: DNA methyltransferase [Pseudohongiellaceae bacterium]